MVNEKTRRMEYLIYILTVGLLATTAVTFRIMNTLAKEVANIKKKIKWKTALGPFFYFVMWTE